MKDETKKYAGKIQEVYPAFDASKHVCSKLTDGMIYIEGHTMYRVKLEPIQYMEYASVKENDEK